MLKFRRVTAMVYHILFGNALWHYYVISEASEGELDIVTVPERIVTVIQTRNGILFYFAMHYDTVLCYFRSLR